MGGGGYREETVCVDSWGGEEGPRLSWGQIGGRESKIEGLIVEYLVVAHCCLDVGNCRYMDRHSICFTARRWIGNRGHSYGSFVRV